jgi:hypothetical protein
MLAQLLAQAGEILGVREPQQLLLGRDHDLEDLFQLQAAGALLAARLLLRVVLGVVDLELTAVAGPGADHGLLVELGVDPERR